MTTAVLSPSAGTSDALKKLSRYCCAECGAKELFLYCWKGCRHVHSLKAFYSETRTVQKELATLNATIYDQEVRVRELEMELRETQQSLQFLVDQVQTLPHLRPECSPSEPLRSLKGAPEWTAVAVRMICEVFDEDSDRQLSSVDLLKLTDKLKLPPKALKNVATPAAINSVHEALLQIYDQRGGIAQLRADLQACGILFGTSPTLALSIASSTANLAKIQAEAMLMDQQCTALQEEVSEKMRATARLREAFALTKATLDGKDDEKRQLRLQVEHSEQELCAAKTAAADLSVKMAKAAHESNAAKHAVRDLRALVDDQVTETEKWQRYCWDLEERVVDAMHSSHVKERDLCKTRESKNEELRKNRLLYLELQKGKRHFGRAPEPTSAEQPMPVSRPQQQQESSGNM